MPMVFITSGTSFVVPADCNKFDWIDCIGEGGGGHGGGGAWSRVNNLSVTPGSTIYCQVGTGVAQGVGGKDTWINKVSNSAPTSTSDGCLAKGGAAISGSATAAGGGSAASCIGDAKYSGGASGANTRGGGGGAAGPNGNGNSGSGMSGGSADAGHGGAAGNTGGTGTEYDATHGSGGGGNGNVSNGGAGGKYGGGAGLAFVGQPNSGGGLIAYSYTPVTAAVTGFNMPMMGL